MISLHYSSFNDYDSVINSKYFIFLQLYEFKILSSFKQRLNLQYGHPKPISRNWHSHFRVYARNAFITAKVRATTQNIKCCKGNYMWGKEQVKSSLPTSRYAREQSFRWEKFPGGSANMAAMRIAGHSQMKIIKFLLCFCVLINYGKFQRVFIKCGKLLAFENVA